MNRNKGFSLVELIIV
ncbi:MAG: prepilin-type N-terminal cleavage/methylation domain-containing protein, partial [Coprococcus sp.]